MFPSLSLMHCIGKVYHRDNVITGEGITVKMEPLGMKNPKLGHEWRVYKSLGTAIGIPHMIWFGAECSYKVIIMSLLRPSLEDLFHAYNCTFNLKTVLMLVD
jgi:hypothetical protein